MIEHETSVDKQKEEELSEEEKIYRERIKFACEKLNIPEDPKDYRYAIIRALSPSLSKFWSVRAESLFWRSYN